ncbi:MAG: Gfo/Idh/MocA family oxidoreductase [Cytophagales bacterium]|nr:Gfo/Idh/MocA family oxidoreductase [Cytophagales bacterium]
MKTRRSPVPAWRPNQTSPKPPSPTWRSRYQLDRCGISSPAAARQNYRDGVRLYAEPSQLLSDPHVQLVSICTYTESHVDLAIAALARFGLDDGDAVLVKGSNSVGLGRLVTHYTETAAANPGRAGAATGG